MQKQEQDSKAERRESVSPSLAIKELIAEGEIEGGKTFLYFYNKFGSRKRRAQIKTQNAI